MMMIIKYLRKFFARRVSDNDILAMADGTMLDVTKVSDPTFAKQLLGNSVAFKFEQSKVTLCSPANGQLTTIFPTGHAFGITTNTGVEILVHIGVDTVRAKGTGFRLGDYKQGDIVSAGDPIVMVNMKELSKKFDMSTMLIITNSNHKKIQFIPVQKVKKGQRIIEQIL